MQKNNGVCALGLWCSPPPCPIWGAPTLGFMALIPSFLHWDVHPTFVASVPYNIFFINLGRPPLISCAPATILSSSLFFYSSPQINFFPKSVHNFFFQQFKNY